MHDEPSNYIDTARPTLALTWIDHRRIRELCSALDIPLVVHEVRLPLPLRYLVLSWRTLKTLTSVRPRVVLAQNPSLGLALFCLITGPILRFKLVIDAHNEGVEPFVNDVAIIRFLTRTLHRCSHLTIVTNRFLADVVRRNRGRPFILPDRVPAVPPRPNPDCSAGLRIAVISTFAIDEPFGNVVTAARGAPPSWQFLVTGNSARAPIEVRENTPSTMRFTGFLPDHEYWELLHDVDVVLDLTDCRNCLVCGAYEGIAAGKPLVLTNNAASIELFGSASVFCDNSPEGIIEALKVLEERWHHYQTNAIQRRQELKESWSQQSRDLLQAIHKLGAPPTPRG